MPCSFLAVQIYDWLKYDNCKLVSVRVEVVEVSMLLLLVTTILSLIILLHVMLGAGTPIAVQMNVTSPPASTIAS